MEYGIPIPKSANLMTSKNVTLFSSGDYDSAMENIFNNLVSELGVDAYKSGWVGGGDDSHTTYTFNLPNFYNATNLIVSWESLIGLTFGDFNNSVPSISTKWTTGWSRMYYPNEPNIFFSIRPQDNSNDLGMNGSSMAYYNDRVIVFAEYIFRDGNKNNNFKIIMDFRKNENSYYGVDTEIYYMASGSDLNPYVWAKLFNVNQPNNIEVLSADRSIFNFKNGGYALTKYTMSYDESIEYHTNIKHNYVNIFKPYKERVIIKTNNVLSLANTKEKTRYESENKRTDDWIPRLLKPQKFNHEKFSDVIKDKVPSQHIIDSQKISMLYEDVSFKGFIEGKSFDDQINVKLMTEKDYILISNINTLDYNFNKYTNYHKFIMLVDGRFRHIDINKPMIKGYISGKINTSGCSGQSFKIRCYRHSNNDFIGEYNVDVSGNYFIPNLNYLDEYDIMLVDSNSVIETKVSSKRKPILNDEINELKLGVHTSTLNTDLLILFEFSLLKFSYNRNVYPYVQDDATLKPKPYEMYYNISTSYPSYIQWWDFGQKYYMNSNAHITDVRYIDNNNVINNIIKNAEFEITVTFNHFGHSYSQWNSLFACSDTNNQGNFLYIYNDSLSFGMYDKVKNITYTTTGLSVSRNKVYTAIIKRKGNLVTLTMADAITLDNKFSTNLELPSDFTWDFSKIKLGCAWGSSQFWGDFVDFEFKIL